MKNKKNVKIQNGRRLFEKIVFIYTKKRKIEIKKIPTSLISVESHYQGLLYRYIRFCFCQIRNVQQITKFVFHSAI